MLKRRPKSTNNEPTRRFFIFLGLKGSGSGFPSLCRNECSALRCLHKSCSFNLSTRSPQPYQSHIQNLGRKQRSHGQVIACSRVFFGIDTISFSAIHIPSVSTTLQRSNLIVALLVALRGAALGWASKRLHPLPPTLP